MKTLRRTVPNTVSPFLILPAVTLACLLPFIGKAFHIDDPLFVWCARHIQSAPFNFYGFNLNWDGCEKPMAAVMQNPPLTAYYLALVGLVFGWSEMALHAGFLLPALAVILGTYCLARNFCSHPFAAALAVVATPAFLVASTSVMCDTMMVAFWVWAMFFWIEGLKQNAPVKLCLAGLLIAACGLTKYFGFCLIPLLLVYSLLERRPVSRWIACLALPVVVIILYQWMTRRLYGTGLMLNAVSYATHLRIAGGLGLKVLTGLAFSGGCMVILLLAAPLLWGRRELAAGVAAMLLIGLLVVAMKKVGVFPVMEAAGRIKWLFVTQFALFAVAGVSLVLLAVADLLAQKTPASVLLFLWVVGTFVFACAVNWTVSGRNILPMLPAVSLLLIRRLEARELFRGRDSVRRLLGPLAASLTIALFVTQADYRLADSARAAASFMSRKLGAGANTVGFEGHWGFQFYMEMFGAKALDKQNLRLVADEAIVIPLGHGYLFRLPEDSVVPWFTHKMQASEWVTTMNVSSGAGYYSDAWGPLPFVFGPVPPDVYFVCRVR
ncbi:MAG: glycosyltransferase family 39 protein [Verrucomicrobiota bacterium]|jgi:4-amino-4-deoxy-L-arabinose transferase-like glycosyltransferase